MQFLTLGWCATANTCNALVLSRVMVEAHNALSNGTLRVVRVVKSHRRSRLQLLLHKTLPQIPILPETTAPLMPHQSRLSAGPLLLHSERLRQNSIPLLLNLHTLNSHTGLDAAVALATLGSQAGAETLEHGLLGRFIEHGALNGALHSPQFVQPTPSCLLIHLNFGIESMTRNINLLFDRFRQNYLIRSFTDQNWVFLPKRHLFQRQMFKSVLLDKFNLKV